MRCWRGVTISCRWRRYPPGHKWGISTTWYTGGGYSAVVYLRLEVVKRGMMAEEGAVEWGRRLVHYTGEWERPGREIPAQGHQSVRYLDVQGLAYLDLEKEHEICRSDTH